jgi:hypothetical protein
MGFTGMTRRISIAALALAAALAAAAEGASFRAPEARVEAERIVVSARLELTAREAGELKKGIAKEIDLFVDLFRVWNLWPDEFVEGRKVTRALSCDPVKKEYHASSLEGSRQVEKRFGSCEELMDWALSVRDVSLPVPHAPEPAMYFVRVIAEGKRSRMPPFVNMLFFFVSDDEFRATADSARFPLDRR